MAETQFQPGLRRKPVRVAKIARCLVPTDMFEVLNYFRIIEKAGELLHPRPNDFARQPVSQHRVLLMSVIDFGHFLPKVVPLALDLPLKFGQLILDPLFEVQHRVHETSPEIWLLFLSFKKSCGRSLVVAIVSKPR